MPLSAVYCTKAITLIENGLTVREVANVKGYSRLSNRALIRFGMIGRYERRPRSGKNKATTARDLEVFEELRKVRGVDVSTRTNPDFSNAIEELVYSLLKIGLTGHNVEGTEFFSQMRHDLACGFQMDVRECGDALENDMLRATFPLVRVSVVGLSWFGETGSCYASRCWLNKMCELSVMFTTCQTTVVKESVIRILRESGIPYL
ncbi:hypothetical protein J6590_070911 [Homalodisca vitripennis]|nr:hypothetical protein J6590_070911 [Homalodisca vitripennis]